MARGETASSAAETASVSGLEDLLPNDDDLLYEEELLRNPFSLKMWWRYIEARKHVSARRKYLLYERALKSLPGSYKLWIAYLAERRLAVRGLSPTDGALEALNNTYERALVTMHKMPRIWLDYLSLLVDQRLVTRTRRSFDRALCALPITQHDRIWQLYLKFLMQPGIPTETAVRVYRRYLKIEPTHAEEHIAYLRSKELWGPAARMLAKAVDDDTFVSLEGKTKHQLWLELCDIITRHPREVTGLKVDAILRSGIRKFTNEVGRLWAALADYYIRQGLYEKARDVYEEGLTTVVTVRDFSLIFDTLTQFEETLLQHQLQTGADDEPPAEADGAESDGEDFALKDNGNDIDLRLARLQHLMERRPELLSSVMLRQNPHNVHEWHKRVKLFEGNPGRQITTYTEAVTTVDPNLAIGKLHTLWIGFARFYERHGDIDNARVVFEKAIQVPFKYLDDLAAVWCEAAEMELQHKQFRRALDLMRRATAAPLNLDRRKAAKEEKEGPVQGRLYRSLRLWSFYVDLEESLGTLESTKAVYSSILDLRIATPQIVLNYAEFLQEHKYWEEAFQVYERGVALFKYPHVRDIWKAYLSKFVQRYGGTKLERARDLFRQALDMAPPESSRELFLQFAALEEKHGLSRSAMAVYERAVRTVPVAERFPLYELYLARASDFFGVGKVREIYETAIEGQEPHNLTEEDTKKMCQRYAQLERKLGEIDRARAILVHASGLADPRTDPGFWSEWQAFEVAHGNEDTFREMMRIKRSVAASFSQTHFNTSIVEATLAPPKPGSAVAAEAGGGPDDMQALEAAAALRQSTIPGFVSAGVTQTDPSMQASDKASAPAAAVSVPANQEDIELADVDEMDDQDEADQGVSAADADIQLQQQAVPDAVFGSVPGKRPSAEAAPGALERFKRAKAQ